MGLLVLFADGLHSALLLLRMRTSILITAKDARHCSFSSHLLFLISVSSQEIRTFSEHENKGPSPQPVFGQSPDDAKKQDKESK